MGRAGYVCGALWLREVFGREVVPLRDLVSICSAMVAKGAHYARRNRSPSPLMYEYYGTEYLGAAHGLSSILQVMLSVPAFMASQSEESAKLVKDSVDYMLGLQGPSGNIPCAMDEVPSHSGRSRVPEHELVHWCHGAPGTIYLFARAFTVFREEKYLQAALQSGNAIWERGLLKKGPGICHGVAGNAYAFLLLYRLTKDPTHVFRAKKFAEFMQSEEFRKGSRTPDCPYSLYEGIAGTACFLIDLLDPDKASFPFFEVLD